MNFQKIIRIKLVVCIILTIFFFISSYVIYVKTYEDPRWRVFDFNSRQASKGDIYNVAEIPAIKSVKLVAPRKLRFEFTPPFETEMWMILSAEDRRVISEGVYPEIQFPGEVKTETYIFIPDEVVLMKEIVIKISFYPGEKYHDQGLSWPDNYYSPYSSVPFSITKPYSLDEWAGLSDTDPDVKEARMILGDSVKMNTSVVERSNQVFRFVMEKINDSGGTPNDAVQNASPLETYEMLSSGSGKGWCENRALVYYLFANAAGVKTRLVDIAGKFGPLKLTGHYFCESWDTIQAKWFFVDPMSRVACIRDRDGKLLDTLEIKNLFDLDKFSDETVLTYDESSSVLVPMPIDGFYAGNKGYFTGDVVLAYKFGYPRNRNYSKLEHFRKYLTLLYAPFTLPKLYLIKSICIIGFKVSFVLSLILGVFVVKGWKRAEDSGAD